MRGRAIKKGLLITYGLFFSCALYIVSILNFGRGLTHSAVLLRWVQPKSELPIFLFIQLPILALALIFLLLKILQLLKRRSQDKAFCKAEEDTPDISPVVPLMVFSTLAVLSFLIWWYYLSRGYFFWDDHEHIPWVRYLSNPLAVWLNGTSPGRTLRPVTWFFLWIECRLWGVRSASGYYASGMGIHFLNVVMIYVFGRSIIGRRDIPLLAVLIIFFLPVATRANLFICSVDGSLQMLFCLLSLWFFKRYLFGGRLIFFILSLFAFLFSIMSKEQVIIFPLLIIAFDLFWGTERGCRQRLIDYVPYWCIAVLFMIYRTLTMGQLGHISDRTGPLATFFLNPFLRLPRALFIFDEVISGPGLLLPLWRTILMSAVIVSLLAISFKKTFLHYNKLALFAVVWIIIFSLPVIFFYPWSVHIYAQSFGFSYLLASLLDRSKVRLLRAIQYALFSVIIALFACRSYELMMDSEQDYDLVRGPLYMETINAISDFVNQNYPHPDEGTVFIIIMEEPHMWRFVSDRYIKTVVGKEYYTSLFLPAYLPDQTDYFRGRRCLQQTMVPLNLRNYIWLNPDDFQDNWIDDDEDERIDNFHSLSPNTKPGRELENLPDAEFAYPPERLSGTVCAFVQPAVESLDVLMANKWNPKVLYINSNFEIEVKYDPSIGVDDLSPEWLRR